MSHHARRPLRPATLILPLTAALVVGSVLEECQRLIRMSGDDAGVEPLQPFARVDDDAVAAALDAGDLCAERDVAIHVVQQAPHILAAAADHSAPDRLVFGLQETVVV